MAKCMLHMYISQTEGCIAQASYRLISYRSVYGCIVSTLSGGTDASGLAHTDRCSQGWTELSIVSQGILKSWIFYHNQLVHTNHKLEHICIHT